MRLSIIVAMDKNRLIGVNGRLPWRLPEDMTWFRKQTMGKPVIMGRKTFESIPERFRPLPGRRNIVLTRRQDYEADGTVVVHTIKAALTAVGKAEEAVVIGGAELYRQLLPQVGRLYLTLIDAEFDGDTFFPVLDQNQWHETFREYHPADNRHEHAFTWLIWERKKTAKIFYE